MIGTGNEATAATERTPTTTPASSAGQPATGSDTQLHWHDTLRDGTRVLIRPIHREDAALERAFIDRLTPESLGYRFLGQVNPGDEMIRKLTDVDLSHDMAFVALRHDEGEKREIGVSRFYVSRDGKSCECTVTVGDEWQGRGLGYLLMRHLIDVARQRGIKQMYSIDSANNYRMRELAQSLGFERKVDPSYPSEAIHTLAL
jgi:GNAT superfamily N-acetyltransferase